MANLVRTKTIGVGAFIILLTMSFLLKDTHENWDTRYKVWSPDSVLYINDFLQGDSFFENVFAAQISSAIALQTDEEGIHKGITLIDRFSSWYKEEYHSPELLNHETYHANLTAAGTQKLNHQLNKKALPFKEAQQLRNVIQYEIYGLQQRYDEEANHGINMPLQHYWEYKIDSMYNSYEELDDKDIFSGISCNFPAQPEIYVQQDSFLLYKVFVLEKYGMRFRFLTKYDAYVDTTNFEEGYLEFLESASFTDIKSRQGKWQNKFMIHTECSDTVNNRRFYDKLIIDGPYEYQLTVFHPLNAGNDIFYKQMKDQFFESLEISSNKEFWISYLNEHGNQEVKDVTVTPKEDSENYSSFTSFRLGDHALTYHPPFINEDKLIIAFRPEKHYKDDIDEVLLMLNDKKIFAQEPDSLYQIISLDVSELRQGNNTLQFGYLAKSDTIKDLQHLYSSIVNNFQYKDKVINK